MKYIYVITNTINNKQYVGQHITSADSYMGSGSYIKRAIKKYGKENFKKEFIEECKTQKETNERETYWIKKLNTLAPLGYNLVSIGQGHIFSEEMRKRAIKSHRGINAGKNNANYKNGISLIKHYCKDCNKQINYTTKGKRCGSCAAKERFKNPKNHPRYGIKLIGNQNPMFGKKHSYETRLKMSLKQKGKLNPSYKHGRYVKND